MKEDVILMADVWHSVVGRNYPEKQVQELETLTDRIFREEIDYFISVRFDRERKIIEIQNGDECLVFDKHTGGIYES